MKKYIDPIPDGGAPLHNNRLNTELQKEFWDAIEATLSTFSLNPTGNFGIIISGCAITPNGGNFDIAAGIVFLNGEFMRLPAATNQTFTKYIAPKAASNITKIFGDGASKNLIVVKDAELVGAAPGAGQYITISSLTSANPRYLKAFKPGAHYVDAAGVESFKVIKTKIYEIGDWNMDASSSVLVTHSIADPSKIRRVQAIIRHDTLSQTFDLYADLGGFTGLSGGFGRINAFEIQLNRISGGAFDNTNFDATSFNRGWVIIDYEDH